MTSQLTPNLKNIVLSIRQIAAQQYRDMRHYDPALARAFYKADRRVKLNPGLPYQSPTLKDIGHE